MLRPRLTQLIPVLAVGLVAIVVPTAIFGTPNCYNYSGDPCDGNSNCYGMYIVTPYCKQLCPPYVDLGCCEYAYWQDTYNGPGNQNCPCAGGGVYTQITGATLLPTYNCYLNGVAQPCDTDTSGGQCQ
jgi:hypothetical protein